MGFLVVDGKPGQLDGNQMEIRPAALLRAHALSSRTDICAIKVAPQDQVPDAPPGLEECNHTQGSSGTLVQKLSRNK